MMHVPVFALAVAFTSAPPPGVIVQTIPDVPAVRIPLCQR